MYVCRCVGLHIPTEARGAGSPLELGLQTIVNYLAWVLGIEPQVLWKSSMYS